MPDDETPRETMTADELIDSVSRNVTENVTETLLGLSGQLGELDARLDGVAGRVEELSGQVEQATLQAGEELGPVLTEEIGPAVIDLLQLLIAISDGDEDGAADVTALTEEIRQDVADVSAVLLHPALETPFTSYTVLEALLLLLLFSKFVDWWKELLKAGFSWMR